MPWRHSLARPLQHAPAIKSRAGMATVDDLTSMASRAGRRLCPPDAALVHGLFVPDVWVPGASVSSSGRPRGPVGCCGVVCLACHPYSYIIETYPHSSALPGRPSSVHTRRCCLLLRHFRLRVPVMTTLGAAPMGPGQPAVSGQGPSASCYSACTSIQAELRRSACCLQPGRNQNQIIDANEVSISDTFRIKDQRQARDVALRA